MVYIIVDLILAAIIIICTIIGFIKGFIDQVLDLVSGIAAFFTAYFVTPLVAPFVNEHLFYNKIATQTSNVLHNMYEGSGISALFSGGEVNEAFKNFISKFGADYDSLKQSFSEKAASSAEEAISGITEKVANPVSYAISYALCFIVIFIAALFLLWLIKHLLDLAAKLPVIKHANKALGLVTGALLGILVVWVVSLGLKLGLPYLHVMAPEVFPEDLFEKSYVLRFSYYLNALRSMIDLSYINNLIKV